MEVFSLMSKQDLYDLKDLKDGEIKTIRVPCGSTLHIERFHFSEPGFYVGIEDPSPFVDLCDGKEFSRNKVRLIILDSALPTLRMLLCGLSHNE